ncbi:MAG: LPXTG cell wall anchor domain-containing protein [Actinomycetia bacterium]|nr:LPXTG cell wall anchor domain-containing protein [Actinomycetes bacterium]
MDASVDLNALMPYYNARRGGIDARCPELLAPLRTAVYAAIANAPVPGVDLPPAAPTSPPDELPRTGSDSSSILSVAAATTAIGVFAWAATSRDAPVKR